jgi:predicted porin
MNKSAIALAVAAALAASASVQADTTLYGSARVSIDYVDQDGFKDKDENNIVKQFGDLDGQWDVKNNSSRLGVRGSEDLGGGLSAIYQYEFGVDMTEGTNFNSNRPKLVGLKGGFGQVSMGTQWTPYYNVLGVNDVFNSGRTFVENYIGPFRKDNSVIYQTPNWGGFSMEGMGQFQTDEGRDSFDTWEANALYENGPFLIGAAYIKDKGGCEPGAGSGSNCLNNAKKPEQGDNWGAAIAWSGEAFGASLIYEYQDLDNNLFLVDGDEVGKRWNLNGVLEYSFGSNILRGSYANVDNDQAKTTKQWILGYQYNLSKRSRLWVEYIGTDNALVNDSGFYGITDNSAVSIGMRHDF